MTNITAPPRVGSRNQARKLLAELPPSLSGSGVEIDCSALSVATPSFIGEVIQMILVDRDAKVLRLAGASQALTDIAREMAAYSGVSDRLEVNLR